MKNEYVKLTRVWKFVKRYLLNNWKKQQKHSLLTLFLVILLEILQNLRSLVILRASFRAFHRFLWILLIISQEKVKILDNENQRANLICTHLNLHFKSFLTSFFCFFVVVRNQNDFEISTKKCCIKIVTIHICFSYFHVQWSEDCINEDYKGSIQTGSEECLLHKTWEL